MTVTPGRRIPLNPANTVRAGGDVDVMDGVSLGGELAFTGSQYFDGDPSNLNAKLPVHRGGEPARRLAVRRRAGSCSALVDNLFDNRDALYGTYFDPSGHRGPGDAGPDRSAHPDPAPAGQLPARVEAEVLTLCWRRASLYMGAMLRLTDIKLPLDHGPEALKAAILKKLKLPAEALVDWQVFKRGHDARNTQAIAYIYTVDVRAEGRKPRARRTRGPRPTWTYKPVATGAGARSSARW